MNLLEKAKKLSIERKNRDSDYKKFISSRRFRRVKRAFKKKIIENAKSGHGRISSDGSVCYSDDMYSKSYVYLSDKEFEYLRDYYTSHSFEVEINNDDKDSNDKYNTIIIIWDKDSLY